MMGAARRDSVARVALGLAALGRPAYINLGHGADVGDPSVEAMREVAHRVLDAAHTAGIRRFDAARSYGLAEDFLAGWLAARAIAPGTVEVSSKWGYAYTADWRVDAIAHEVKELTAERLRTQWQQTRALLGDHIGLYQIHSATLESGVLDDGAVRAELDALRDQGVRVGLSVTGPRQADTINRALETGGFDAVQATWNLHERSAESALADAHAQGLTVMLKEVFANGRLTDRGGDPRLAVAAAERGVGEDAIAMAAALARPWADVVLSGAATVEQLRANLRGAEVDFDPALEQQLQALREPPEPYWRTRAELHWN